MKNERSFAANVYETAPQVSNDRFEVDPSVVYGPITTKDAAWMGELGADTSAWDEKALGKLNTTLEVASHNLHYDTDPETTASVMAARREFYEEILGWGDEGHFLHGAYKYIDSAHDTLILASTAVNTARYITNRGINIAEVVKSFPEALAHNADSVKAKMENFTELGLDAVKVVNGYPAALSLNPDSVKAKMESLTKLGLDAVKVMNGSPAAISLNPDSVRAKMDNLTELGLDAVKVVNGSPVALNFNLDSIKAKMDNLTKLGLDAVKVTNGSPTVIGLNPESVKAKMNNLTELGLDAVKVVNAIPTAISYNPDSVKAKMNNLTELGLDAVKVVNTIPTAIGYNPDSVKNKMDNLTELGLDAMKVVNAFPMAIGLSPVNIRLKARALQHALLQELLTGADVSEADIRSIFILPTESLLTFLALKDKRDIPSSGIRLSTTAKRYTIKELGVKTGPQRHEHISNNWDKYAKNLGHVALEWADYKKLLVKPEGRQELELYDAG